MITVNASRKYGIFVEKSFDGLKRVVDGVAKGKKIMVVTDENVEHLYLKEVVALLNVGYEVYTCVVPAGENSKCIKVYAEILENMAEKSFKRDDLVLALGGGVIGDLAAFAASTYMRGVRLVAVPTTLLSMIDSSVGGKTAVNLSVGKNLCGTFYQPYAVYANISTLATLPDREILCGKGELVKYAVLDKRISAEDIDRYDTVEVVEKCIEIKKEIVEADEFEGGKRMLLNLGHTIGHAIEALSGYTLPHGLCVLKGLYKIAAASKKAGYLKKEEYEKVIAVLDKVQEEKTADCSVEDILKEIAVDKKSGKNGVSAVFIRGLGDCFTETVDMETMRSYLE